MSCPSKPSKTKHKARSFKMDSTGEIVTESQADTNTTNTNRSAGSSKESAPSTSFDKLQHAVEKSVQRITSKKRVLPYIKEHFQQVYRADSKNVLELYKSMMSQLEEMIKEEIELQLDANNVQELLGNLDTVKVKGTTLKRNWRPSGNPAEDIKAHLQESSQMEVEQLEKILSTLEFKNKLLNESVVRTDEKLQQSLKKVQDHCSAWKEASLAMSDKTRQDLIDMNLNVPLPPNIDQDNGL